jgi:non-ribosomal peptide synthetase-like protein
VTSTTSPARLSADEGSPERPIDDRPLSYLGGGAPAPARTLIDIFNCSAEQWPHRVALEDSVRSLTYRQLTIEARQLAERLALVGVRPGHRVGVRVPSGTVDLYIAVLGTLLAGAAYVPVDFGDPEERAQLIWREASVSATVGEQLAVTARSGDSGRTFPPGRSDDCWVIFTSGSTGTPKGVVVGHRAAAAFVDAEAALWHVRPNDRVFAGLSVGFDASCEEMWLAWRNGAALVACPRSLVRSGVELGSWLLEHDVTVISTVPTLAAMWESEALAKVRLLILGGEACSPELGWRLAEGREVWNTYGPTEATVVSTAARVRPFQPITIGHPLSGWDVAIVDPLGHPVVVGEVGEFVIAGVGLGRYLNAELDARLYAGIPALGWARAYHSGDLVRQGPTGLEFVGRHDDQVKVGGRRIELAEIDAQLRAVPGVKAAATAVRRTACDNPVLVGYVVGDVDTSAVRTLVAAKLPAGIVPRVVRVDALPLHGSGKVDRAALPWPLPADGEHLLDDLTRRASGTAALGDTATWLAERWMEQLGPEPIARDSNFFELGGTSLSAAKLVSVLRSRFSNVAIADLYNHRQLGDLADRLDHLAEAGPLRASVAGGDRHWGLVRLVGLLVLVAFGSLQWLLGLLAYNQWYGFGPRVGWAAMVAGWLVVSSPPGRAAIVIVARRVLVGRLQPGRYPREGWFSCRFWFVHRLGEILHLDAIAGTPWAARYARLCGTEVGPGARLATLPPPTGLVRIGSGATLEADVDLGGWWIEGRELVIGTIRIGDHARIGTRCHLMPGTEVGAGAEIEPGSVVTGSVPPGERWSGSPARSVGRAGETWPAAPPLLWTPGRGTKVWFALGLGALSLLPLMAAVPSLAMLNAFGVLHNAYSAGRSMLVYAPLIAVLFIATYALLVVIAVRSVSWLIKPGWHADTGGTAVALWFSESMLTQARGVLFPLYSSVFTRSWLRLLGIEVGRRTEVSTAVGLNPLVRLGDTSFVADDVVFCGTRARGGRLEVAPISVGDRSFLGNGAILRGNTVLGDDCLVGVLSSPPLASLDGTSWLGHPALELPRVPDRADPARTIEPPGRLVVARGAMELVRIVVPAAISIVLGGAMFLSLESIGGRGGIGWLVVAAPLVLAAASLCAVGLTIAGKWLLMGRYKSGEHPLWSFFVWRDELVNTLQEHLAGAWLLTTALGTPLLPAYLRAMGSRVGAGVWFETLAVTEFDLVDLGDGCAINRGACIETHLFHDRLLRMGPARIGSQATLGPDSAVLPNTVLGSGCTVGARSVVLRGERLPPDTRWHGAPVQSA